MFFLSHMEQQVRIWSVSSLLHMDDNIYISFDFLCHGLSNCHRCWIFPSMNHATQGYLRSDFLLISEMYWTLKLDLTSRFLTVSWVVCSCKVWSHLLLVHCTILDSPPYQFCIFEICACVCHWPHIMGWCSVLFIWKSYLMLAFFIWWKGDTLQLYTG